MVEWNHYRETGLHLFYGGFGSKELGYLCKVCNKSGGDVWQVERALMFLPFYPDGGRRILDGKEPQEIPFLGKINIVRDAVKYDLGEHSALEFAIALLTVYSAVGLIGTGSLPSLVRLLFCILSAFFAWHLFSWRKRTVARLLFTLDAISVEYEDGYVRHQAD